MGVDTKGLIKAKTTESELLAYLNYNYTDVESRVSENNYDDYSYFSGFISFNDGEEKRQLFYISESFDEDNIEDMKIKGSTYLSLGFFGNSVEIMKGICKEFGGAINEKDCDDKGYYWVNKDKYFENIELTLEKELEFYFGYSKSNKILELVRKYAN